MENKTQYKQSEDADTVAVAKPSQVTTLTSTDIKIKQLEDQIAGQHQLILKLKRDIGRIKGDISDIMSVLNNRG